MKGQISANIWFFEGNPINALLDEIDAPKGAFVVNTSTTPPTVYLKSSGYGDNSNYATFSIGSGIPTNGNDLPINDPLIFGSYWNDGGFVALSQGTVVARYSFDFNEPVTNPTIQFFDTQGLSGSPISAGIINPIGTFWTTSAPTPFTAIGIQWNATGASQGPYNEDIQSNIANAAAGVQILPIFDPNIFGAYWNDGGLVSVSAAGSDLPTNDPQVVGQYWNNGGFLCVSAGIV